MEMMYRYGKISQEEIGTKLMFHLELTQKMGNTS